MKTYEEKMAILKPLNLTPKDCEKVYLDYFNNYVTFDAFLDHHPEWTEDQAREVLHFGRFVNRTYDLIKKDDVRLEKREQDPTFKDGLAVDTSRNR
tara:strand:+ start:163 stop:450 length:288 start_codon:yes stop_codon:yes gene_type:complete